MPDKHGPGTHLGYQMPPPGQHSKKYAYELRMVYGACRVQNPGEDPRAKAKCAAIAHSTARRLYGF